MKRPVRNAKKDVPIPILPRHWKLAMTAIEGGAIRELHCVSSTAIGAYFGAPAVTGKTKVIIVWPNKCPERYDLDAEGTAMVALFDDLEQPNDSYKHEHLLWLRAPKPRSTPPALSRQTSGIDLILVGRRQKRRLKQARKYATRNLSGILYTKL